MRAEAIAGLVAVFRHVVMFQFEFFPRPISFESRAIIDNKEEEHIRTGVALLLDRQRKLRPMWFGSVDLHQ